MDGVAFAFGGWSARPRLHILGAGNQKRHYTYATRQRRKRCESRFFVEPNECNYVFLGESVMSVYMMLAGNKDTTAPACRVFVVFGEWGYWAIGLCIFFGIWVLME